MTNQLLTMITIMWPKISQSFRKGILAALLFSAAANLAAQEQPGRTELAQILFDKMEYAKAAHAYENLVKNPKRAKTANLENLANSYYFINKYSEAEKWYEEIVSREDAKLESYFRYANVLKTLGKYDLAKDSYKKLLTFTGVDAQLVNKELVGIDSAILWSKNPQKLSIRNEKEINTPRSEFSIVSTPNGVLYAAEPVSSLDIAGMTGEAYLKVFSATRNDEGILSNASLSKEILNKSDYHIGPIFADKTGETLYVTRTHESNTTENFKMKGDRWYKHNLELVIYKKNGDSWTEEYFPYNNVKEYSVGHAALSPKGDILYFASNRPGGFGGIDIWYVLKQNDGSWGEPVNAGSTVNTPEDEMFPTVDEDFLYFSSNGHVGMGGLDIFRAKGSKNSFENAQNIGLPINSSFDDFSYTIAVDNDEKRIGYFTSNKEGGAGSDDIYSFTFIKPTRNVFLDIAVYNKESKEPIANADLKLLKVPNQLFATAMTDVSGKANLEIARKTAYQVYARLEGYMSDSTQVAAVNPTKDTTIHIALHLQPINKVGIKFVLENIYYDFDKHDIRPDAAIVLDKLVATMLENPTLRIELSSHTDSRGSDSYNEKLSQRRASSAVEYIVSKGVDRDRLVAKGYGESRLVNNCVNGVNCSDEEHQANRRTEVEVIGY